MKLQKPFLKWVGGKTQIIDKIIEKIPKNIKNYHEPFVGGGSVLLALLTLQKEGDITIENNIYAYDLNLNLINVYKAIQNNKDKLFEKIEEILKEYDNIEGDIVNRKPSTLEEAKTSKESYYYWIRNKYNKSVTNSIECSAMFIFINKTCFRGIYRVGPNGYNVPYGHYKKTPVIITKKEMDTISELIKKVIFIHSDFKKSIESIKNGDFVYLDPPYVPEKKKSFVGYNKDDFIEHKELFGMLEGLDKNNIKFIMSNSVSYLSKISQSNYNYEEITTRRAINSKNPGSTTKEVIICN